MAQITKDMTFGELLSKYYSTCPKLVDDLMEAGMGCIGCPHSQMESIEEGAMGHGIDPDLLVAKLNATLPFVGRGKSLRSAPGTPSPTVPNLILPTPIAIGLTSPVIIIDLLKFLI